ncbi:MAG: hypothetical protein DA408_20950 [Bacteroidetes bacterium]|nr:MAG: hypothetical protein C7N36_21640 [Bacteroidota bacterium]PTM08216.1 MAG: hypothetical protein DA408_20950 [Bacteroidota bacterium]
MSKQLSFICPIAIKDFELPTLSPALTYLLADDPHLHGEDAVLAQLGRLFEIPLEVLAHPVFEEAPVVVLAYDPFLGDWTNTAPRDQSQEDRQFLHELAMSLLTGEADDEMEDLMAEQGWSRISEMQAGVGELIQYVTAYPGCWRAVRLPEPALLKPYVGADCPTDTAGQPASEFLLDMQELLHFATQASAQNLRWFGKVVVVG